MSIQSIRELRESGYKKVSLTTKTPISSDFWSCLVLRISLRPRTRPLFPLCITAISQQSLINFTCCIWTMCFWKSPLWRKSSCTTMSKEVSGMVILKYELKRHRTYILGLDHRLGCVYLFDDTDLLQLPGRRLRGNSLKPWAPRTFTGVSAYRWNT